MVRLNWGDPTKAHNRPKAWSVRCKAAFNRISVRLIGRSPFQLTPYDLFGEAPRWQQSLQRSWRVFWKETSFPYAILLLAISFGVTIIWKLAYPTFLPELWPEMGGTSLEILFLLILFSLFEHRRSRSQFIERQRETIDDHKRWDNPEARVRIAGAIRRLNRKRVFAIDFSSLQLSDFSFARHGIDRLTGSSFYDGTWGKPLRETGVTLTNVSFDHIDCVNVEFSPFDPFESLSWDMPRYAKLRDCTFVDCNLRGARFNGASLDWSNPPPDSHYEIVEDDEAPGSTQVTYGSFDRADVSGASFQACRLTNADFRNAEGLLSADFFRARGLESAEFDDEETRLAVLASANRSEK